MGWFKDLITDFVQSCKPHRCEHEWKCVRQVKHRIYDEPWDKYPSEQYIEKTWECKKCGEIKYTSYDI
jgi:hypothetical protein